MLPLSRFLKVTSPKITASLNVGDKFVLESASDSMLLLLYNKYNDTHRKEIALVYVLGSNFSDEPISNFDIGMDFLLTALQEGRAYLSYLKDGTKSQLKLGDLVIIDQPVYTLGILWPPFTMGITVTNSDIIADILVQGKIAKIPLSALKKI